MSRTIADLTEGTEIYIDEQGTEAVEHIPYIYLGIDDYGNARVWRKYCLSTRVMDSEAIASYGGCDMDIWLEDEEDGFLCRFNAETINCLVNTTIGYSDFTENQEGALSTIARRCFLLSNTELGYTNIVDEGRSFLSALKTYYNTTDDYVARIPRTSNEGSVQAWLRSGVNATQFSCEHTNGYPSVRVANSAIPSNVRPALSIAPTTLVSDEGAEQIALLPSGEITSWGIRATMSLGQSTERPKRCKLYVPADDFDTAQYWVCNNFLDTNPTWVPCTNGGVAVFGTTKTAAIWELGVKVEASSGSINKTIGEPVMAVDYGSSGDE